MLAAASGQAASTTTALAVSPASPVASGTVVTLTATVVSGSTPANPGQVRFCDAAAAHCEDSALLATAQLTSAGIAIYKFRPGLGSHSYQAVFAGTKSYATSASAAEALTVTGPYPTTTTIASSGSVGNYTLTATVAGTGSPTLAPTGSVSFLNTTDGNASLGSAELGTATPGENFASTFPDADGIPIVGDFNGDGIPDLAVINLYGNSVTVLLGHGDGTFTTASTTIVGGEPNEAVVGDFNGDGIADLAVANSLDNTVTILLGKGDGTFTTKATISVGDRPWSIATGDFNGDGIPDLATSNLGDDTVTVLQGNGDGTFTTGSTIAVGSEPESIAVGDFNGDGMPDLTTANSGDSTVTVLLGKGDGTFSTKSTPSVGTQPSSIMLADFNGDGVPDIVVTYFDGISVLVGNGNGTFTTGFNFVDYKAFNASEGDFNGDGIPDLVVVDYVNGDGTTTILVGKGDGSFTAQTSSGPDVAPGGMVVGDFNGDGLPDLAMAQSPLVVLLNQLTQTATASLSNVSISGSETQQILASYPGDANYNSSTSSTIPLLAAPIVTKLNLSSSINNPIAGNPITLTATLSPYSEGTFTTNSETITFYDGETSIGSGTLSAGVATLSIARLLPGTNTLTATYSGDGSFSASTSSNVLVTISQVATTLQLYSSANPSAQGASITLAAVLSPYISPGGIFTVGAETVTFYNGGTSIGTATLSSGVATLNIASLPDGTDTLTASYPGDSAFSAATSNTVAQAVNVPFGSIPGFAVTVNTDTTSGVAANCTTAPAPNCSLRDALAAANAAGSGNITFNATVFAAPQTIALGNVGGLNVPPHTTITGPTKGSGATLTNLVTVSGGGPVFTVNEFATNTAISGLTITGGVASYEGGGILNSGVLTVSGSTISGNNPQGSGAFGGGIANLGVLTLINSTVTGNTAEGPGGITSTPVNGGGIGNGSGATLTITNSTVVGNTALNFPGGTGIANLNAAGGGIYNGGTLTMTNSIVAGNSATTTLLPGSDPESYGDATGGGIQGGLTMGFNNIISGNTSNGSNTSSESKEDDCDTNPGGPCPTNGQNGNIVGPNALLAPLGNYGGPTQTTPPLPGSPAICAGLVADIPAGITTDQRGFPRTTTYGSNPPCVDSGPVQTNYSLSFSTQPPSTVSVNTNFTAAVQLSESGSPFPVSGVSIPLALAVGDSGALNLSSLTTAASGIASSGQLQVSAAGAGDALVATLPVTTAPPPPPLTSPLSIGVTSSAFDAVATQSATTTTLTTSAMSVVGGTSVTFTASVSSSVTSPAPTGTVQFYDGSTPLGSAVTLTGGSASYSTTSLSGGTHSITAVYSGDTNFASSTSAAITENIEDVTAVLGSSSASVAPGGSVTETLTLTSLGGLNGATTFECSGLPTGASCSFNPSSVTGSGSTTLTIATTGSTSALAPEGGWLPGGGAALAGILLIVLPGRRRTWARMLGVLALCFVLSTTGCGGGSGMSSGGGGGTGSSGTPAGTYTITVTATTGSGASAISSTVTFQLTVT
ncbi:MAG: Ig-like domain repeat protein [Acidobacteriaceae bacterium]